MAKNWNDAQENEKIFWESIYLKEIKDIDTYQKIDEHESINFSNKIINRHKILNNNLNDCKILDVGCGPYGIIKGLHHGRQKNNYFLYGIDPLMDTYLRFNTLPVDDNVKLYTGVGENLPFESDFFNFVFCTNVLDHCEDPKSVLSEISRVLKNDGEFCTSVHVIYPIWRPFRFLLKYIDKNHPHHFTESSFCGLLLSNFRKVEINYRASIFEDQPEFKLRHILKSSSIFRGLKRYFSHYILFSIYYNCKDPIL